MRERPVWIVRPCRFRYAVSLRVLSLTQPTQPPVLLCVCSLPHGYRTSWLPHLVGNFLPCSTGKYRPDNRTPLITHHTLIRYSYTKTRPGCVATMTRVPDCLAGGVWVLHTPRAINVCRSGQSPYSTYVRKFCIASRHPDI